MFQSNDFIKVQKKSLINQYTFQLIDFNKETHWTDIKRISKLMVVILNAYARVCKAGIYLNRLCPFKTKNH
jgi:hypothetical protein